MKYTSALLTAASGSLKGITASHNRGGAYLRGRVVPTNPNTARQQQIREILGSLANAWTNQLSVDQRASWNTYATAVAVVDALGAQIKLSGVNMFIRSNTPRLQAGLARVDDAPTDLTIGDTPIVELVSVDSSDGSLGAQASILVPAVVTDRALLFLSRPVSGGRSYFNGPYQFAIAQAATVLGAITVASGAYPYTITPDSTIYYRMTVTRTDGRYSAAAQGKVQIA